MDNNAPELYIQKGYISANDNAGFRKITDCIKCFGIYYAGCQMGTLPHPLREDVEICFAKLSSKGEWINNIADDENTIYEHNIDPVKNEGTLGLWVNGQRYIRYVFVYSGDSPKEMLYRFKGEYTLNREATIKEKRAVWERTALEVPTIKDKLKIGSKYKEQEEL